MCRYRSTAVRLKGHDVRVNAGDSSVRPIVSNWRWPLGAVLLLLLAVFVAGGLPDNWSWWAIWPFAFLLGLAGVTDTRISVTGPGLVRRRHWWTSTVPWEDVEAVECKVKLPATGAYSDMLTIDVWRHSRAQALTGLTTPESWGVAFTTRTRARRQAEALVEALRARGVPARSRDWPLDSDEVAIPSRWW
jgi:hypothetical protein